MAYSFKKKNLQLSNVLENGLLEIEMDFSLKK